MQRTSAACFRLNRGRGGVSFRAGGAERGVLGVTGLTLSIWRSDKETDMTMEIERFTLTERHVKLLRRMFVGWCNAEFGAPALNPKRPYGNSYAEGDMAEILNVEPEDMEDGEKRLSDRQHEMLRSLHRETETALQVVLTTGAFEPGDYEREKYIGDWCRTANVEYLAK